MSRVRIGGAGGRRNVRPCHMQHRTVQFLPRDARQSAVMTLHVEEGRGKQRWIEDISDWSCLKINTAVWITEDRQRSVTC